MRPDAVPMEEGGEPVHIDWITDGVGKGDDGPVPVLFVYRGSSLAALRCDTAMTAMVGSAIVSLAEEVRGRRCSWWRRRFGVRQ